MSYKPRLYNLKNIACVKILAYYNKIMAINLENLEKAINSLDEITQRTLDDLFMSRQDLITRNGLKAGVIKNFEFTYELCWKHIQRWLEINIGSTYIDGITRRELFRLAQEKHIIDDSNKWFNYHDARNISSHTYNVTSSDLIFNSINNFVQDAKNLLNTLKNKND